MQFLKNKKEIGAIGEEIVVSLLEEKGVTVLERNFRCRFGEIDVIARDGDKLVFIEVKTRKSRKYGVPEEAVDYRKQRKLRSLAAYYLAKHAVRASGCRFDVYSVCLNKDDTLESVRVLENCF